MNQYVPSRYIKPSPLPRWMPRNILGKIRICQNLYRRAKRINSPIFMSAYRSLRNQISSEIKASKSSFRDSLANSPSNVFWSYTRSLRKSKTPIPNLLSNSTYCSSDHEKASTLNSTFSEAFNTSCPPLRLKTRL